MNFDLRQLPAEFYDDPFPVYRRLRESHPVYRCPDGSWFLSRHEDVTRVYRDATSFSSDKLEEFSEKYGDTPLFRHHTTSLVFNDPPLHTIVRKRIAATLKPSAIQEMQTVIEDLVDTLLDRISETGEFDGITDFATHIPVEVIGNLLGVPREQRGPLRAWSLAILGALEASISESTFDAGNRAVEEFSHYLDQLIASRRSDIAHGVAGDDLLTRLVQNHEAHEPLTDAQLVHNAIFILNAGHETTTNLIGNGIHALLCHPRARRELADNPDTTAMDTAIDELLRFESPNQLGNRITTCDVEIGGTHLPAGSRIWIGIGAANRDPEVFSQPDELRLDRKPNPHLAFAAGIHSCIGLNVARMEARIAISKTFERFPDIYATAPAVRSMRARFRGFTSLPLSTG